MITFLHHKEINKQLWDDCILHSQQPLVYGLSWYLDAVSPSWCGYVIERNGNYVAVFPLPQKTKWGFSYITQPLFCQQLGLFYKEKTIIEPFLNALFKKYSLVHLSLNHSNVCTPTCEHTLRTNLELPLNRTPEDIVDNYTINRKRDLKKAIKQQVSIRKTTDIDFFITFFKKEKGLHVSDLSINSYAILKKIYAEGKKKSAIELTFAYDSAIQVCAVALFLKSPKRIIFLLGTSNKTGQKNGSMTYIMNEIIRENCERDIILDFEGSNIPGVAKFYESLGGKEKKYISLNLSRLPVFVKILQKIKNLIQ